MTPEDNIRPIRDSEERLDILERMIARRGNDGGGGDDMDSRVAHLETRVGRIETKLDQVIERLSAIATKADMRNYLLTATALFVAVVAILVAGMGWLETRAARVEAAPSPAPIIVELPAAPSKAK